MAIAHFLTLGVAFGGGFADLLISGLLYLETQPFARLLERSWIFRGAGFRDNTSWGRHGLPVH